MSHQESIDKPEYSNMDEMLVYFESKGEKLDSLDLSSVTHYMENNFVSNITFGGVPILPPMMTTKRRKEMETYRRQACLAENRLKSSKREKIAKRAQSFIEDIQNISGLPHSSSSPSRVPVQRNEEGTVTPSVTVTQIDQTEDVPGIEDTTGVQSKQVNSKEDITTHTVTEDTGISTSSSGQCDGLLTESALGSLRMESFPSGEPAIPSFLESLSDYQSLEEMGVSLPSEYGGLPLTSTKQKQISQLLAKLSRDLNIKDSLTSTSSSANSETLTRKSQSAGDHMSALSMSQYSTSSQAGLYQDVVSRDDSQDTIPELINSVDDHLGNESASTIKSITLGDLSVDDKSMDSIRSPKSPKNNVHFASTVTEIYTDNKSGESSTLQKSLQSPASTPRSSAASLTEGPTAETLLRHLKERRREMLSAETKELPVYPPVSQHVTNSDVSGSACDTEATIGENLLSKVVLSPEYESSSSSGKDTQLSDGKPSVPFQSYAIEGETSDKENEYMISNGQLISNYKHVGGIPNLKDSTASSGKCTKPEVNVTGGFQTEKSSSSGEFHTGSPASRPDSNLSRVSLHSMTTSVDTDTLSGRVSLQSDVLASQDTGDSVSTIRASVSHQDDNQDASSPDHCDTVIRVRTAPAMNIPIGGQVEESNPDKLDGKSKDNGFKKAHTRQGSYTLEQPSPALVRAWNERNISNEDVSPQSNVSRDSCTVPAAGGQSRKVVRESKTAQQPDNDQTNQLIKRKLDYDELDEDSSALPPVGQVTLQAEREGKREHLNRYLDYVRQQSEEVTSEDHVHVQPTNHKQKSIPDILDNYTLSSLSSFSLDHSKVSHMSQEELFDMQATHFDKLRKTLVEQQKQQVEHLFLQQQQEQLLLQREIEERCRLITEQQEFLGDQVTSTNQGRLPRSAMEINSVQVSKSSDPSLTQTRSSYSYITSPSLVKHPNDKDNSFVSTFSKTSPKQSLFGNFSSPPQQTHIKPVYHHHNKPVVRSPPHGSRHKVDRRLPVPNKVGEGRMKPGFDRVSAVVKGYLTRRLLRTEKVQNLIKTVRDTRDFAVNFQSETPIKQGKFSVQDQDLLERIIAQLQAALLDIHEVFFEISTAERMSMIAASRQLETERRFKELEQSVSRSQPRISMATLKAMERKKRAQAAEASVFGASRPQSAPPPKASSPKETKSIDLRALRPLQGHISPIHSSQEEGRPRSNKDRPRTAPDRVTVANTHRTAAKSRKPNLTGAQGQEHRRPSKSLLVKARPVSSAATATVTATKPGKSKSGKAWR